MPDFYIVCFVLLFPGDATSVKDPVCDEGTN